MNYSNKLDTSDKLILNIMMFKDYGTFEHSIRVGKITEFLLNKRKVFKEEDKNDLIIRGAYLHDIGKVLNNLSLQMLPRGLSDDEFYLIKNHPIVGYIISKNLYPKIMLDIIKYHHYNPNTPEKSYPILENGDMFENYIQLVEVVDKFTAMAEIRPYKGSENLFNIMSYLGSVCNGFYGLDLINNYCVDVYKIALEPIIF